MFTFWLKKKLTAAVVAVGVIVFAAFVFITDVVSVLFVVSNATSVIVVVVLITCC